MLQLRIVVVFCISTVFSCHALAAKYFVDFADGSDSNDGQSVTNAFKHAPGDSKAKARSKTVQLKAGDTVVFKGGVRYRGTIQTSSGSHAAPIIYDGNTDGKFGTGPAIIDGSLPLTGWRKCTSAKDAMGNTNWQHLWTTYAPGDNNLFNLNLCQSQRMLNLAQHPNPKDDFFYDLMGDWHTTRAPYIERVCDIEITPGKTTGVNSGRPLVLLADGDIRTSAVLNDMGNSVIHFTLPQESTITALGIANLANYNAVSDFEILAGSRVVLSGKLKHESGLQRFDLAEPIKTKTLTFRSTAMHKANRKWGAIGEIQAYNTEGENVLRARTASVYTDADFFDQSDPHYWDNATLMLFAKPATTYFRRVNGYDPQAHRLSFETFIGSIYRSNQGRIALLNAPKSIDKPGEWSIMETPEPDGRKIVLLWPHEDTGGNELNNISFSPVRNSSANSGFIVTKSSYVTIQGFVIERFAGRGAGGISGSNCSNILLRGNEVRQLAAEGRSEAIGISRSQNIIIQNCNLHHNRRCSAIILNKCSDSLVQDCVLDTNGSTALDYYGCSDSKIIGNTVSRHKGVHANGLTMYLGCKNILVEGNTVFGGNVALTAQDGDGITIQNNVFDGGGKDTVIGLWRGKTLHNVYLYNNLIIRGQHNDWAAAIYCDNPVAGDFIIRNNIIDGWAMHRGKPVHDHNIFTHKGIEGDKFVLKDSEIYVPDTSRLFANASIMDFSPKPDSPAINAGAEIEGRIKDILNKPIPAGKAPDIGPFEYRGQ